MTALERQAHLAMIRARAALVLDHPFFGSIALRLTLKPDPTCSDLWTDGRTLGFNPSYAAALSEAALIGAQAHEVMHLACAHHVRRGKRDRALWNKACDFVVNQLLLDAGFSLPQGSVHDPAYAGFSVEALYSELARLQDEAPNKGAERPEAPGGNRTNGRRQRAAGRGERRREKPEGFHRKRLHPTLDWRGILQRFLENCADGDSTWTTPNRRYLYQGIYLPSRQEPRIPHIVLAVDSSGSVDNALLEMFCTELSGILESYDTLLTVLFHDTRVQSVQTFTRQNLPLRLAPAGGGGTDYRPGYRLYRGKRSRPHLHDLVYRSGMRQVSRGARLSRPLARGTAERDNAPLWGNRVSQRTSIRLATQEQRHAYRMEHHQAARQHPSCSSLHGNA